MRVVILALSLLLCSCHQDKDLSRAKNLKSVLEILDIKTQTLGEATVVKSLTINKDGRESFRINAVWQKTQINFDIDFGLDQETYKKYSSMIQEQFLGNYYSRFAPYSGEITKKVVCTLDYYPTAYNMVLANGITATFFRTYVNARHAWGVCEKDEIAGVRFWGFIYIPNKKILMNVKFTYPKDQVDQEQFFTFVKNLHF